MNFTRRESLKLAGAAAVGTFTGTSPAQNLTTDKIPARLPLDEFVKDAGLLAALRRGIRAMKARPPSDPLSWFYQAAIHGASDDQIKVAAIQDPNVANVDREKFWNQCPHNGEESANFLPWHRGYTHYFERILRAHTGEPRFALPYWDITHPTNLDNRKFPREFGISEIDPLDGVTDNPLWHNDRNVYFASWEHWSGNNLPYSELTAEAVDWSPARDAATFFSANETDGLGGGVSDIQSMTRGRLESFPHDPVHRLTGIIVPDQVVPDPDHPGQTMVKEGYSLGMSGPPTAGFDPIFCVHHSNIDRLWTEWSLMAGKVWGPFPAQEWFDEKPWFFFDAVMEDGKLKAVEVNKARKAYFNHRELGISFKYEDLTKAPLLLPDPVPAPPAPPPVSQPLLLAKITAPTRVTGLMAERVSTELASSILKRARTEIKPLSAGAKRSRVVLKILGVDLSPINATGFEVHLTGDTKAKPKRTDPSFLGTIALFRHDSHKPAIGHEGHASHAKPIVDSFDVTRALEAAGQSDPNEMFVVIIPYSLAVTVKGQNPVVETSALKFESIEFVSVQE